MERIKSFEADHTKIVPGVYISRTDGDIVSYDVRLKKPNADDYLSYGAIHTIEHLFATYMRNCEIKDRVIYVGPMGCRTGFYLLIRNSDHKETIDVIKNCFAFISDFEGEIPGNTEKECGNYKEHDLIAAKKEAKKFADALKNVSETTIYYK